MVMPDMPTKAVNAGTCKKVVTLMLVTKSGICGAWVGYGEVDFLACRKAVDWEGGSSCGMTTHQLGGKDSKKRNVLKVTLPQEGGSLSFQLRLSIVLPNTPRCFLVLSSLKQAFPMMCSTSGGAHR